MRRFACVLRKYSCNTSADNWRCIDPTMESRNFRDFASVKTAAEVAIHRKVGRHPGLLPLVDAGETATGLRGAVTVTLLTPLYTRGTLFDLLQNLSDTSNIHNYFDTFFKSELCSGTEPLPGVTASGTGQREPEILEFLLPDRRNRGTIAYSGLYL